MVYRVITSTITVPTGDAVELGFDDDVLVIAQGAYVVATDSFGATGVVMGALRQRVEVSGQVFGSTNGIEAFQGAEGGVIHVTSTGRVDGFFQGISSGSGVSVINEGSISGRNGVLEGITAISLWNSGSITGRDHGVQASVGGSIFNSGVISGSTAIQMTGGSILNRGTVAGSTALRISGTVVSNYGTIDGVLTGVIGSDLSERLVNRGAISGDIILSGGDDQVTGIGGTIDGTIWLGSGNDSFRGGASAETVAGQDGLDDLSGGDGDDVFQAYDGDGSDDISGGAGLDTYDGRGVFSSALVVDLGAGTVITRGAQDDLVSIENAVGGNAGDLLIGSSAANRLAGEAGADTVSGLDGNDTLAGGSDADLLDGGNNNDRLRGGDGRDSVLGGNGTDVIRGEGDADVLTGGAGADRFDFNRTDEFAALIGPAIDRITDFQPGSDRIDLSDIDPDSATFGDQDFDFVGSGPITGIGEVRVRTTATSTFIEMSIDQTVGITLIRLDGVLSLTEADFLL